MIIKILIICLLQIHFVFPSLIKTWNEKSVSTDVFINKSVINSNSVPENTVGLFVNKYAYDDIQVTEINNITTLKNIWMYDIGQSATVKFQNLPNLIEIDISRNDLTRVPASMFVKTGVRSIWLNNNKISKIQKKTFGPTVTLVSLYCNLLTRINPEWFEDPSKITWLELHGNKITHIKENTFKSFVNLKHINLVFNEIHTIEDGAFSGGDIYNEIYLAYNKLTELPPNIFSPGRVLIENFDIRYNQLTYLSTEFLNKTTVGNMNLVDGNPWSCACYLNYIEKWVNNNGKKTDYVKQRDDEIKCVAIFVENYTDCIESVNQDNINFYKKNSPPLPNTRELYCPCRRESKSWKTCFHI